MVGLVHDLITSEAQALYDVTVQSTHGPGIGMLLILVPFPMLLSTISPPPPCFCVSVVALGLCVCVCEREREYRRRPAQEADTVLPHRPVAFDIRQGPCGRGVSNLNHNF